MHEPAAVPSPNDLPVSVAIIPWGRLGDGVIFLILADNLRRAGYQVTYYSDTIYQMRQWLPQLTIFPAPGPEQRDAIIDRHDVVINDVCSPMQAGLSEAQCQDLARRTVSISTISALPEHWQSTELPVSAQDLLQRQPELHKLLNSSGVVRTSAHGDRTMVDYAVEYCQHRCGLSAASARVELAPPQGLVKQRHKRRIAIFPTTDAKKEYSPQRFIKVAEALSRHTCEPHFIVLPGQLEHWKKLAAGWPVHSFNAIDELASFIYESGIVLSNDSGGGHLASMLGLPTVTLYRKQDDFEYRPGWGQGVVVRPLITPKLLGKRVWMPFLSPSRVTRSCLGLLAANGTA